jgi:hypothetical protein
LWAGLHWAAHNKKNLGTDCIDGTDDGPTTTPTTTTTTKVDIHGDGPAVIADFSAAVSSDYRPPVYI